MAPINPPSPGLSQNVFDALHAFTYDSSLECFKDAGGTRYYMFVEGPSSGAYNLANWNYDTSSSTITNPRAKISQSSFDIMKNGTYNSSTEKVSYNGKDYRFLLIRDGSDVLYADATG